MSRILILLLLLLSVSFSSFHRPWNNETWISENPNIWTFGAELWWNVPELQKTLDSLGTGEYPDINGSAKADVEKAESEIKSARNLRDLCILRMLGSLGAIPFSPGQSFLGFFSKTSECTAYREKWKSSVDHTLKAVDDSLFQAKSSITLAKASYAGLVFSGICESSYAGPSSENCSELRNSFLSISNSIPEGNYGKYSLALEKSRELDSQLLATVPDLSSARNILDLVWKKEGAVDSFGRLRRMAELAEKTGASEFQSAYKSGITKKITVQSMLGELEKQDYELIDRAPSGFEVGSIAKRFSNLKNSFSDVSFTLSESKTFFDSINSNGYLSNSISKAVSSDEKLTEIIQKINELEKDAEAAVSDQENEAEDELSDAFAYVSEAGGAGSLYYLQKAEDALQEAKRANSLGSRFLLLSESAAMARAVKSTDASMELSRSSELSILDDLIQKAEKDGINVISEKEALKILKTFPASVSSEKTKEFVSLIVSKARLMFEADLLERRSLILEKISLGSEDAADLKSELERVEKGIVSEGSIRFPDAIGYLSELDSEYTYIEKELDAYMSQMVGNSMAGSAVPLISQAKIDSPSEITLDLVLTNSKPYSSQNVPVKVLLDRPLAFMFSEIVDGKEDIESIRMAEGNHVLVITFSKIAPYETKRLTLGKSQVIARELSDMRRAEGLGDGSALVHRTIEFELDTDVRSISLPEGIKNPLIDGESNPGPLLTGRHTLKSESMISDAYAQKVENVKVYGIGINSKVEFDLVLEPVIDLETATVFFDSLNDSSVHSFEILSATGETIKNKRRISATRMAAEIGKLHRDREAIIKVSYLVENTKNFVDSQMSVLGSLPLSKGATDLLEKAKTQAFSGNYTGALELLEKSKMVQKEEDAKILKNREKFAILSSDVLKEIALLDSMVSGSVMDHTFVKKLSTRKLELEKSLAESNDSDFGKLEKLDPKWLEKEISALRKDLYKKYNDLKERFFIAGNSSTPPEFLLFEESLIRLESSQDAEYASGTLEAIDKAEKIVELQERTFEFRKESLKEAFETAKSDLLDSWNKYSKQASAAKGTDFSSMFFETERNVNAIIREAESAIEADPRSFLDKLEELNHTKSKLDGTLDSLREQSLARISLLDETSETAGEIHRLRALVEQGEFINALRAVSSISKDARPREEDDNSLPIIGITALAILGATGFYMMKPKKELRKLNVWKTPPENETKKFNPAKL